MLPKGKQCEFPCSDTHPHESYDHMTCHVEEQNHGDHGGEGQHPGEGRHQLGKVPGGGQLLRRPFNSISLDFSR